MRVFVTGAAGFLGTHLVARLTTTGADIVALAQNDAEAARLQHPRVQPVVGSLFDTDLLREAGDGADVVFHCAAKLFEKGTGETIWRTNVEGTDNIVAAAVAGGVRRLVYVSTDSVYGDGHCPGSTEDAPISTDYIFEGNYPRSKYVGETILNAAHERGEIEGVIVRPCLMYGPGQAIGNDILRTIAGNRRRVLYDGGRARLSLAWVGDVATALWLAASVPAAAGRVYNASSGEAWSHRELSLTLSELAGRPRPFLLNLPARPVRTLYRPLHRVLKTVAPGRGQRFDPALVGFFTRDHVIDISRARQELGYAPEVGLREGFARLLAARPGPQRLEELLVSRTGDAPGGARTSAAG